MARSRRYYRFWICWCIFFFCWDMTWCVFDFWQDRFFWSAFQLANAFFLVYMFNWYQRRMPPKHSTNRPTDRLVWTEDDL